MFPGKMRILMSGMLLFSMGTLFGILSGSAFMHAEFLENEGIGKSPEEMNMESETAGAVLDTAMVEWRTVFSGCGHTCVSEERKNAAGMTVEELEEAYENYKVNLFTEERIELRQELQGYCPEHFVLVEEEGTLCVIKTDALTLLPCRIVTLSASPEIFQAEERKRLETGIPFDSLSEIDAYFEGIDS